METGIQFANILKKKKDRESSSSLSFNKFQLATNKMLEYDMPRI